MEKTMALRNAILVRIRHEFAADAVAISMPNFPAASYDHEISSSLSARIEGFATPMADNSLCKWVITKGRLLTIESLSQWDSEVTCSMMRAEGYEAYMGLPLKTGLQVIGALEVMVREAKVWSEEDRRRLAGYGAVLERILREGPSEERAAVNLRVIH